MAQVFISHSSKDLEFVVKHLTPLLTGAGLVVWCSGTDMHAAADWEKQIRTALAQTDWFIVVLSPDAQQSEWVQSEVHWALDHLRGHVVPVMARSCDPYDLHIRLGTIQFVDFRADPAGAGARLLALITGTGPVVEPKTCISALATEAEEQRTTIMPRLRQAAVRLLIELPGTPPDERVLIVRQSAVIGRAADADLQIPDDCVSRKHARLNLIPGIVVPGVQVQPLTLSDLASANGTFLNDQRVVADQPLGIGDLIAMGNARLRVLAVDAAPADGP